LAGWILVGRAEVRVVAMDAGIIGYFRNFVA
jgi:hypothetical protein